MSDTGASYDVVVIGGAAIGSAVAAFLTMASGFEGSVLVVERDPTYRTCSTTLSAASIRQQFSTPVNIAISQFGIAFLRDIGEILAVDGRPRPDVSLVERGYLFLATPDRLAVAKANNAVQRAAGAAVDLLAPDALAREFPWLRTDDLAAGSVGRAGEGWYDSWALLQALRARALAGGAVYANDEVIGIDRVDGRVTNVRLARRGRIACGWLVNAAGPRARQVAAMAGIDLPVAPRKRCVFVFGCRTAVPGLPLLVDPTGCYVRPEGPGFICGVPPPVDRDVDTLDRKVDWPLFDEILWPALAHRIPAFEAIKLTGGWAGHYAMNLFDQNAIVGPHPDLPNFLLANGFSGHGLQQAPAVGRGLAEWIVIGAYRSLDLSPLGMARILAGTPLVEINVV